MGRTVGRHLPNGTDDTVDKLHHIGIASNNMGWCRDLGYEVVTENHDKGQGVYVTVFKHPNSHVLLEFVRPDGPTSPARNMKGMYHLCFEGDTVPAGWLTVSQGVAAAFQNRPVTWCYTDGQLVELLHEPT